MNRIKIRIGEFRIEVGDKIRLEIGKMRKWKKIRGR